MFEAELQERKEPKNDISTSSTTKIRTHILQKEKIRESKQEKQSTISPMKHYPSLQTMDMQVFFKW